MDPAQAGKYYKVARSLAQAATDLAHVADDGDAYGNAIAIVSVHSVIAYGDALCIAYGGFKSTEGEHIAAADALADALGNRAPSDQLNRFRAILAEKDTIAYQGNFYTVVDARQVVSRLRVFADWAQAMYEQRP